MDDEAFVARRHAQDYDQIAQKVWELCATGPNEVSVVGLAAIKKIYAAGTKFSKSGWYVVFQGHRKFDFFAVLS